MLFGTFMRQVGRNIRSAREACGLKQIDVQEHGGVAYRHYQNIEAGRVNVTIETLFRLSRLYKVPVQELVRTSSESRGK